MLKVPFFVITWLSGSVAERYVTSNHRGVFQYSDLDEARRFRTASAAMSWLLTQTWRNANREYGAGSQYNSGLMVARVTEKPVPQLEVEVLG